MLYRVADTSVEIIELPQLLLEQNDLKRELAFIEAKLAEKKAWARADGRLRDASHIAWLAKSRRFRGMLLIRYMTVKTEIQKRKT